MPLGKVWRLPHLTNSHSKRLKIYKNTLAYCVEALITVQKRFINLAAVCQRSDLHPGVNAIKLFLLRWHWSKISLSVTLQKAEKACY